VCKVSKIVEPLVRRSFKNSTVAGQKQNHPKCQLNIAIRALIVNANTGTINIASLWGDRVRRVRSYEF
jgi:hypothetical protein